MFIAHRGCYNKDNIKENSLDAFREADRNIKYGGFELDIWETLDHEFVVTHDFLLQNMIVKKSLLDDLKEIGLCSITDILKINSRKRIMIDIKDFNINVSKLANILNKAKLDIWVMSFNVNVIRKIKPYARYFKCGIINYFFNRLNNYDYFDFIVLLNDTITFNIKEYFLRRRIKVISYGIYKEIIYDNNIDYIIDNYKDYVIK